jgi:hypothetical protein
MSLATTCENSAFNLAPAQQELTEALENQHVTTDPERLLFLIRRQHIQQGFTGL